MKRGQIYPPTGPRCARCFGLPGVVSVHPADLHGGRFKAPRCPRCGFQSKIISDPSMPRLGAVEVRG